MSEKNRPPSAKRLEEARRKGQVAQTPSIPHILAVAGVVELIAMTSKHWLSQAPQVLGSYIARLGETNPAARLDVKDLLLPLGGLGVGVISAALVLAALLGLVGNLVQTGVVVATEGVARLDRLDPIAHAKQLLSTEQLLNLLVNIAKIVAISGCVGLGVMLQMDSLMRLADGTLMQAAQVVLQVLVLCERLSLMLLVVFVAIDWVVRKNAQMKQLRMSREEVDAEQKDQFGDKDVRRQRNEFRRDMLAVELTESTRKANAVVTNPSHFAVALLYDPSKYPLPVVVARGADDAAAVMRRVARDNGIPIIRSVQLARTLYSVGREWRPVPRLTLKAVAAVYRVVAEINAGERRIDDVLDMDAEPDEAGTA